VSTVNDSRQHFPPATNRLHFDDFHTQRFTLATRRFQFQKHRQLLIGAHNETLSVVPVCVNNPERSPFVMYRCNATPTPSCFTEIVSYRLQYYSVKQKDRRGFDLICQACSDEHGKE
jgi:hypothetical protein